jgi:hypothetical protein
MREWVVASSLSLGLRKAKSFCFKGEKGLISG